MRHTGHAWLLGCTFLVGSTLLSGCTKDARPLPEVPESPAATSSSTSGEESGSFDWSYEGELGPAHWSTLKEEWAPCAAEGQSPINVPLDALTAPAPDSQKAHSGDKTPKTEGPAGASVAPLGIALVKEVRPQFSPLPLEAKSDGRLVQLTGASAQGLSLDGRLAPLDLIEIHAPAEHQLGGARADLELVLRLRDAKLGAVALSLLFRKGAENPLLAPVVERLPKDKIYDRKFLGATLDLQSLVTTGDKLLAYSGSDTTPPCAMPIERLVFAYVGELSQAQLDGLTAVLPGKSERPVQPLGERAVKLVSFAPKNDGASPPSSPAQP